MKNNRQLTYFVFATFTLTWLMWIPAALSSKGYVNLSISADLLQKLGVFVPSLVSFVLVGLFNGKGGIVELFKRGISFKIPFKWYIYLFLLIPIIALVAFITTMLFSDISFEFNIPFVMWIPAFFIIMILMGPLGEEFGWRGFALDRLLINWNPLKGSLILGFVWTLWHLPLFFIDGTIQNDLAQRGLLLVIIGYLLYTTAITILMTLVHINTDGNVLAAIIFHTIANMTLGIIPLLSSIGAISIYLFNLFTVTLMIVIVNKEFYLGKGKGNNIGI